MKSRNRYLLFLIAVLCIVLAPRLHAQRKLDSLRNALTLIPVDSSYVDLLLRIAQATNYSNSDTSMHYAIKALQLATEFKSRNLEYRAHEYIAYAHYMKGEYDKSYTSFETGEKITRELKKYKEMSQFINNEANVLIEKGELQNAMNKYNTSMQICTELNDKEGIGRAYSNLSYVAKEMGNYQLAVENGIKALTVFENSNLTKEAAGCYNNIAFIYYKQKNYEDAKAYTLKALEMHRKINASQGEAISLELLSDIYGIKQMYPEAIAYSRQALELHEKKKDVRQIALNYGNLALFFNRQENTDSSIYYYKKAIALNKKIGNVRSLSLTYYGYISTLLNAKQITEAGSMLDSAKAILAQSKRKEDLKEFYGVQSSYYLAKGNANEALTSYKLYSDLKDSLLNEENIKIITETNTRYQTEKKQAMIEKLDQEKTINNLTINNQQLALDRNRYELAAKALQLSDARLKIATDEIVLDQQKETLLRNKLDSVRAQNALDETNTRNKVQQLTLKNQELQLSKKNILLIVSIIIFSLVIVAVYLSYRRYKLKQYTATQALLMKQQEKAANDVIQAEENERRRIASDLHDGVGQVMSAAKMNLSAIQDLIVFSSDKDKQLFAKAIEMVDEGCAEVRTISHQMMPNALVKGGLVAAVKEFVNKIPQSILKIRLSTVDFHAELVKNKEAVLYRIIQECLQNAIKHANATRLDISMMDDSDGISITIEDNGKGFDTSLIDSSTGHGLANIKKRIEYLKATIEWSSDESSGTLVSIHMPA